MEQFQLIIQKTTTGLTTEYSSPGIDPIHPNVIKTLEDERAFATQIVKESDVYSLEITEHFRIYSLIVTDIDKFGRSGFHEFKLYGPRDNPLENFYAILQEIKVSYNEDTSNKSYGSILSTILVTHNNSLTDFIQSKPNNKKYYSFYEENNLDSLKEIFKDKGVFLISKLYALNRSKAYDENVIKSVGLLPFKEGMFKEVTINNPHKILKDIFLNNEKLQINNFSNEFKVLVEPKDVLTYSKLDNETIKPIPGSFTKIEREPAVYKPVRSKYEKVKKESFLQENGVYLLALVIIAVGAWIGFPQYSSLLGFEPNKVIQESNIPNGTDPEVAIIETSLITFQKIKEGDTLKFQTDYKGLDNYVFSHSNNKWSYKNYEGQKIIVDFHREVVKNLKIDKTPILSEEEQEIFILALEKKSGKKLDSKIVEEKNSEKVKTKTPKKEKAEPATKTEPSKKGQNESENKSIELDIDNS